MPKPRAGWIVNDWAGIVAEFGSVYVVIGHVQYYTTSNCLSPEWLCCLGTNALVVSEWCQRDLAVWLGIADAWKRQPAAQNKSFSPQFAAQQI